MGSLRHPESRDRSGKPYFQLAAGGVTAAVRRCGMMLGMTTNTGGSGGNIDANQLTNLLAQFKGASSATSADRAARDELLDQLQDAAGLGGQMVTENDIVRRAEKLIQQR